MARITIHSPFSADWFAGRSEFEVEAATVFDLVRALDAIGPGFGLIAETRAAFGVDGELVTDWTATLPPDAEVLVVPRLAGG